MHILSLLSTLVAFAFAAAVFNRYRSKQGPHLLFWGLGIIFYGLGTLTEVLLSFTYSHLLLKIWYLTGAMLTAAWLGQGTVFLLVRRRRVALALAWVLILASLAALALVLAAPAASTAYDLSRPASVQYKEILTRSGPIILLTILLNVYGTLGLVGGAIYSAYLFWRKHVLFNRMVGNLLIASGALLPAMAGSFVKAGLVDWLYISELFGIILMYMGFLQATASKPAERSAAAALSSPRS